MENTKNNLLTLPGAIIIAGAIVAIAIIWTRQPVVIKNTQQQPVPPSQQVNIRPVTQNDHIFGNPNAEIKIVEYSDPECPFCKMFAPTMEKLMDEYGPTGKVAWVYRNFPLDKPDANGNVLHKNSGHESQALECAAAVGGNDKYWVYLKRLYSVTPSVTGQTPNGLDQSQLPEIAKYAGIDVTAFNKCLSSGQMASKVEADYTDGVNAGITGTPSSFLITTAGTRVPIVGAQSYSVLKAAIDAILSQPATK